MSAFQPLRTCLFVGFLLVSLTAASAQSSNGLSADEQVVLDRILGSTVLFVNDTDTIPQVQYLSDNGTGWVWTASFEDRVVPTEWAVPGRQDGKAVFCFQFAAKDVGLPSDLPVCDFLDKIGQGILDETEGDVFDLAGTTERAMKLPFDLSSLDALESERAAQ
ncbi:MAG: hypothetical protein AAF737_08620 [Pseudomonadota bacterium]